MPSGRGSGTQVDAAATKVLTTGERFPLCPQPSAVSFLAPEGALPDRRVAAEEAGYLARVEAVPLEQFGVGVGIHLVGQLFVGFVGLLRALLAADTLDDHRFRDLRHSLPPLLPPISRDLNSASGAAIVARALRGYRYPEESARIMICRSLWATSSSKPPLTTSERGTRSVMIPSVFMLSSLSMEMAQHGFAMLGHYSASKCAVRGLTQGRRAGVGRVRHHHQRPLPGHRRHRNVGSHRRGTRQAYGPAQGQGAQAVLGVDSPRPRRGAGGHGGLRVVPRFARLRLHDRPVGDDRRGDQLLVEARRRNALTLVSLVIIVSSPTRRDGKEAL